MMTRFIIASKTRPGIDLESLVAKHKLSVVSKSMFTTDGMPILCNDKSMLLSTLEEHVEYKLTPSQATSLSCRIKLHNHRSYGHSRQDPD